MSFLSWWGFVHTFEEYVVTLKYAIAIFFPAQKCAQTGYIIWVPPGCSLVVGLNPFSYCIIQY